jgi:hypothetical protein
VSNKDLRLPATSLRVPDAQNLTTVKLWCEYGIWGLLFFDDQSPWLTLVECLHILFDLERKGEPLFDSVVPAARESHEVVRYSAPLNLHLRHLLFRDVDLLPLAKSDAPDEQSLWNRWFQLLEERKTGLDFGYLKTEFKSFRELARTVELLRTAEIESHNVKRWTSRHLLPLGSAMLFRDIREDYSADRKFLRRTGELLYLMLNRSTVKADLAPLVQERILASQSPWNGLAQRLAGSDLGDTHESPIGYLPLPTHPLYERLGADWYALLSLRSVPIENLLDPLQRISGILQALFVVQRAHEVSGEEIPLAPFFLDVVGAPGNNPIRKLSANQFKRHKALLPDAITTFLEDFAQSDEWQQILKSDAGAEDAAGLLTRRFRRPAPSVGNPDRMPTPEKQLTDLRTDALSTRSHSTGSAFVNHVRQAGLLRSYRRSGTWYAPTDAFLEALVLTTVRAPMEFGEFLDLIWRRYRIVIGPEEVRTAFQIGASALPAPLADLKENERRLEERLRVLGLLDRKSDDCAFVLNPLRQNPESSVERSRLVTT